MLTPVADSGYFDILGNSLFGSYSSAGGTLQDGGPFAVTGTYTSNNYGMTQIDDATFQSVSTAGFTVLPWYHAIPSGLNQLMPSPYNRSKVYASRVQFKVFIDGAATSPMTIACIPWKPNLSNSPGGVPPTLVADIASLPRGKYQQFVQNSTSRANSMSNYISVAEALGVPKRAIGLDSAYSQEWGTPVSSGAPDNGNLFAWRFAYNTAGTMLPLPFTVNVKARYYVELFNEATSLLLSVNGTGPAPG